MKKLGIALASALLIFANGLQAQELPFSFGIKGGFLNPSMTGLDKAKGPWNTESVSQIFNPSLQGGLFAEYAFHDYVGAGFEALYIGAGSRLHEKGKEKNDLKINIQQISLIPLLKLYPMGREVDEGIFSIHLGPEMALLPLTSKYKKGSEQAQDFNDDDLNAFRVDALGGLGYEFPFGLSLEGRFSYGFMDVFKKDSKFKKGTLQIKDDANTNPWYGTFSVGYNFARLLEE